MICCFLEQNHKAPFTHASINYRTRMPFSVFPRSFVPLIQPVMEWNLKAPFSYVLRKKGWVGYWNILLNNLSVKPDHSTSNRERYAHALTGQGIRKSFTVNSYPRQRTLVLQVRILKHRCINSSYVLSKRLNILTCQWSPCQWSYVLPHIFESILYPCIWIG